MLIDELDEYQGLRITMVDEYFLALADRKEPEELLFGHHWRSDRRADVEAIDAHDPCKPSTDIKGAAV